MKKEAEVEKGELGKKQGSAGRGGSGPAHATHCWKLHFKEILLGSQKGENQTATIWWYRCLWGKKVKNYTGKLQETWPNTTQHKVFRVTFMASLSYLTSN